MFLDPHLANVYILKNVIGSRTNLKGLIYLILIKFICETISFLFMNVTINRYINVRPRTEPRVRSVRDERLKAHLQSRFAIWSMNKIDLFSW